LSKSNKNRPGDRYLIDIEKATIISFCLVILLFLLFPRYKIQRQKPIATIITSLHVEDIPLTRQGAPRQPPPRPVIPIASEDEFYPDDITIEDTEFAFDDYSLTEGSGLATGRIEIFQPRPIFEVIPEYSEELQKQGIEGIVKLHLHIDQFGLVVEVIVLENSTGSAVCANAAKSAALKGRYVPAKKNGQPADLWITRTYTFGLQK
jgi:TonB family protein